MNSDIIIALILVFFFGIATGIIIILAIDTYLSYKRLMKTLKELKMVDNMGQEIHR